MNDGAGRRVLIVTFGIFHEVSLTWGEEGPGNKGAISVGCG